MKSAKSKKGSSKKHPERKAISSLIATVLMILITIAAVGIVVQAIMPIIQGNIETAEKCDTVKLTIENAYGFTCYDNSTNSLSISISRGSEDVAIQGFELKFSNSNGESKVVEVKEGGIYGFIDKSVMPEKNSEIVYAVNLSAINISGITGIGIAPILTIGKTSETCKIETAGISVKMCSEQLQFQQMANYTANYTQNQSNNQTNQTTNQTQNQTQNQTINFTISQCGSGDTAGILGYWKGDGNVNDALNLHNGQNNGATFTAGKVGQSFSFDGASNYIEVNSLSSTVTQFTFEFWRKSNGYGSGNWPRMVSAWKEAPNDGHNDGVVFEHLSGDQSIISLWFSPDGQNLDTGTASLSQGAWDHAALSFNGSTTTFYVNGEIISTRTFTPNPTVDINTIQIGGDTILSRYFNGQIDELAFYSRALSQSEIQQHYQRSNAGSPYCNATPVDLCMDSSLISGLSGYWKIDENSGSTTADSLGMLNSTITNPLWVPGKINYALNFTGVGINWITIPEPAGHPLPKTISMWAKFDSFELATQTLTNKAYYGCYLALQGNNRVTACLNTEAGPGITCTPFNASLSLNQWYMITGVYSNSLKVYINGVEDSRIAIPGAPSWISGDRMVGSSVLGKIDEVAIWGRELSAQEISALYNYGFGKTYC